MKHFTLADILAALVVVFAAIVIVVDCDKVFAAGPDTALARCRHARRTAADRLVIAELYRIEAAAGITEPGLLAAAACAESGYRSVLSGDEGKSEGLLQFQGWAKPHIANHGAKTKDPRHDWRASARYWAAHVVKQLPRVRRHCKGRGGYATRSLYLWASANVTAVRYPRCRCLKRKHGVCWLEDRASDGRCRRRVPRCARKGTRGETRHVKYLRAWRAYEVRMQAGADQGRASQ